jgi:hypothetical protein
MNTAAGAQALESASTGDSNTAVGYSALLEISSGSNNVAIGIDAGENLKTGNKNIYVGSPGGTANESGIIRIGATGSQTSAFVAGISGVTVSGVPVLISSTGQLGVQTSSARFKQDINPMGERTAALMQLKPVTFHYRQNPNGDLEYGLIAEDVARVYPELAVKDADGQVQTIRYQELTPMLLNEVQKQARSLRIKDAQIQSLQAQLKQLADTQRRQMVELSTRLDSLTGATSVAYSGH